MILRSKPPLAWTETKVFFLVYGALIPLLYYLIDIDPIYFKFLVIISVFFSCLLYFVVESNPEIAAKFRYQETKINDATHIFMKKKLKSGRVETSLEQIKTQTITVDQKKHDVKVFYHNRKKHFYCPERAKFVKVTPLLDKPIEELVNPSRTFYTDDRALALSDRNELNFPLPDLKKIFKQQLMEPLSFFQIFSSLLWIFDNGFYQPLFMLTLLMISNIGVCL